MSRCVNGTAPAPSLSPPTHPQYLQQLIPCYLAIICGPPPRLVFASPVSTRETTKNTLESEHFSMLCASKLWNSLPITLREHNLKETFKKNIKTYLFSENSICSVCAPMTFLFIYFFFFFLSSSPLLLLRVLLLLFVYFLFVVLSSSSPSSTPPPPPPPLLLLHA